MESATPAEPPGERRRKKKGRPSLLDLRRRSLRLEKLHQSQNPSQTSTSNSTPHLGSGRGATLRNPNSNLEENAEDEDEDEGKRRQKKLRLVLERGVEEVGKRNSVKATGSHEDELHGADPTTPLPDEKLLVFILDRLQKKDTYGVFSEPVDPKELPDYHEIIEHPMDFETIRKKLSAGAYKNLEQFEKDVFLISSNAMRYNAPDTIYYRQAGSIQELARKNFENLRQESDDNEPEPKTVARRGRPPSKSIAKRTVGRPRLECASLDFSSNAAVANSEDGTQSHLSKLKIDLSKKVTSDISTGASCGLCCNESSSWMADHKNERNEEYSGSGQKGNLMKFGKKPPGTDENRRNTYKQPLPSTCLWEQPVVAIFDSERKLLVPLGLHVEYAYARSLARFAVKLGPIGWEIAARRIERALPPGTKFGRGWVGESGVPQKFEAPLLFTSHPDPPSNTGTLPCTTATRDRKLPQGPEPSLNDPVVEEAHIRRVLPQARSSDVPNTSPDLTQGNHPANGSSCESSMDPPSDGSGGSDVHAKTDFQFHQNFGLRSSANGVHSTLAFNTPSQVRMIVRPIMPVFSVGSDALMMPAQALDMGSRSSNSSIHQTASHMDTQKGKLVGSSGTKNSSGPLAARGNEFQVPWRCLSMPQEPNSIPPDSNVRFQLPGSPASSVIIESQQPDLALQL